MHLTRVKYLPAAPNEITRFVGDKSTGPVPFYFCITYRRQRRLLFIQSGVSLPPAPPSEKTTHLVHGSFGRYERQGRSGLWVAGSATCFPAYQAPPFALSFQTGALSFCAVPSVRRVASPAFLLSVAASLELQSPHGTAPVWKNTNGRHEKETREQGIVEKGYELPPHRTLARSESRGSTN